MKDLSKEEGLIQSEEELRINQSSRPTEIKKRTPYRFVIIIIYLFLNCLNGMHWVTFASCAAKIGKFYHLNNFLVDLFSLLFMIVYPMSCIPDVYIIHNISIYVGLSISSLLLIIGSFLKVFINTSLTFAYIGQLLTAIFQPAILYSPELIADIWFDENRRTLVKTICHLSKFLGISIGYLIHTFVIVENTVNPKMWKASFEEFLLVEFITTLALGIIFLIFMRNKPKGSPRLSQNNDNHSIPLKQGIKSLSSNKNFIKLLISLTCIVGFLYIFGTIFNSYMALYTIKDSTSSYISASAFLLGIITALIFGLITNKIKKYKLVMLICNIISVVFFIITIILMEVINKKKLGIVSFICYPLILGSSMPINIIGMNAVNEMTVNVGESITGRVIMTCNNIMGIIGIIICDIFRTSLKRSKFITNLICLILFVISGISLFLVNFDSINNKESRRDSNGVHDKDDEKEGLIEK